MPLPVWVPGQVLASADVNNWFVPLVALKTSTQSVTSSTVNVNDTQLFLNLPVNTTYFMWGSVLWDGAAGGDFKMNFTIPAGATMNIPVNFRTLSGVDSSWAIMNGTNVQSVGSGAGTTLGITFSGVVTMGSTTGNTQMVWAQNTSNATATRVFANSCLIAFRIG